MVTAHPDLRLVGSIWSCQNPGCIDGKPEELGNSAEPESDRPGAGPLVAISHMPLSSQLLWVSGSLSVKSIDRYLPLGIVGKQGRKVHVKPFANRKKGVSFHMGGALSGPGEGPFSRGVIWTF